MIRLSTLVYSTRLLSKTLALSDYYFSPSPFIKILVKCHQATASNLLSTISLLHKKVPFLKISDDVIACDLWFRGPPIKNSGYAWARQLRAARYFLSIYFWPELICPFTAQYRKTVIRSHKAPMVFETSATLCIGSPFVFFSAQIFEFCNRTTKSLKLQNS